jgi:hypothetical protein
VVGQLGPNLVAGEVLPPLEAEGIVMRPSWRKPRYALVPVVLAFLVTGPFGCVSEQENNTLERVRNAPPITDRESLGTRLRLPSDRLAVIITGEEGKDRLIEFLSAGETDELGYTCTSAGCVCVGDDDCNLMFTQVCSATSTNGVCSGEPPICVCHP